jgi:NADH-quinone oxidoreductase subunit F
MTAVDLGIDEWRRWGTPQSPGTKWFCLSGHVARPGLYKLPFGLTVREIIARAGGATGGEIPQAVLMGGAAGVFIGPEQLDMPLTYEDARSSAVPLGSGVIMVFNQDVDLRRVLYQLGRFFAHESCGKCFPCQLGTQRQVELLGDLVAGRADVANRNALLDVGFTMSQTSLCGLGQTAASAVLSAIHLWPSLFGETDGHE